MKHQVKTAITRKIPFTWISPISVVALIVLTQSSVPQCQANTNKGINGGENSAGGRFFGNSGGSSVGLTVPLNEFILEDLTSPLFDLGNADNQNQQVRQAYNNYKDRDAAEALLANFNPIHYQRHVKSLDGNNNYADNNADSTDSIFGSMVTKSMHQQNNVNNPHLHNRRHAHNNNNNLNSAGENDKSGYMAPPPCHPTEPFACPNDDPNAKLKCIPIQYLCDGAADCPKGYDEDNSLCTATKRPPVLETKNFLKTLITTHGSDYIEKLFGPQITKLLLLPGGPDRVAIALSVSRTIEDFGKLLRLEHSIDHLRNVLVAVQTMDGPMLKSLGIVRNSELADIRFFLEKLLSTGFLD